jgi:PleD family two-component response regulator
MAEPLDSGIRDEGVVQQNRRRGNASPRVVIADDDRDTVDTLSFVLRDAGYIVHGVYSGKEFYRLPACCVRTL